MGAAMPDMPKKITAWPGEVGPMTGAWSANQYDDERATGYTRDAVVAQSQVAQNVMVLWVAIAPEDNPDRDLLHMLCESEAEAKLFCGRGWRVGKFQEVPNA